MKSRERVSQEKRSQEKRDEKERQGERRKGTTRKGLLENKGRTVKEDRRLSETSRPKARDGLRYPCPAYLLVEGSHLCKQGFGPKAGRSPVEHRGNLYVCAAEGFGGWLRPPRG